MQSGKRVHDIECAIGDTQKFDVVFGFGLWRCLNLLLAGRLLLGLRCLAFCFALALGGLGSLGRACRSFFLLLITLGLECFVLASGKTLDVLLWLKKC